MGEDIRIVSITGENIRKLTTVAVRMDGEPGVFRITSNGENEEGKTTLLNIAAMLFGGKKAVKPDTIQFGQNGAWAHAELTNGYGIERKFNATYPDGFLTLTDPDGNELKAAQGIIDGWVGNASFDPGGILKKRTKDIEAAILCLAKDPDLKEKRDRIAKERSGLTDERRPLNSTKQKASRTKKPEGTRPDPVDVSGEMERLKGLREELDAREHAFRMADDTKDRAIKRGDAAEVEDEKVERLKEALVAAEGEAKALRTQADDLWKEAHTQNETATTLPDPTESITAVESHIADADEINESLEPWKEYDRSQKDGKEAGEKSDELTKQIKALDKEEEDLLKAAEIPVDGITFSEEGDMLLYGFSIEVASGMQRLRMACDMAYAENSDVKVCLLDEADSYSKKSIEEAHKVAREKGFQVLACQLGKDGPGEIIIEDGTAKGGTE